MKANLEVTLTQALSVSQLKYASALSLSQETLHLLSVVASNLVGFRGAKELGADSPLLPTLLQFSQRTGFSGTSQSISTAQQPDQCFAGYMVNQNLINRQYALSHNQTLVFAQQQQSMFIEQNRLILKNQVEEIYKEQE